MTAENVLTADGVAFILVAAACLLTMLRLAAGPTLVDRVVAADTLSVMTTAGLVWLASALDSALYLDIALVYGALSFIGVVAIARVIEHKDNRP